MKVVETKITCDTCEKDISPHLTGYPAIYILKVSALNIAENAVNGEVFAVGVYPPITHDLHFCNLICMKKYGDMNEPQ